LSGKEQMLKRRVLEKEESISYFLTGKVIGASNKGSQWSADSLLKTILKFVGLSSGSSGKLAADGV
jgi:hypothetical protein